MARTRMSARLSTSKRGTQKYHNKNANHARRSTVTITTKYFIKPRSIRLLKNVKKVEKVKTAAPTVLRRSLRKRTTSANLTLEAGDSSDALSKASSDADFVPEKNGVKKRFTSSRGRGLRVGIIMPAGLPNPMPGKNVIRDDPNLISRLCLDWSAKEGKEFRKNNIPSYRIPPCPANECVPKLRVYAIEKGTHPRVERFIKNKPATWQVSSPDPRAVQYIDAKEWVHTVEANENAEIINAETGEIWAYVIRDFLGDEEVLASMDEAAKAHCKLTRDVRAQDPGGMYPFGYSAGARHIPEFMPCRNLDHASGWSEQQLRLHNHGVHSAATLIWNVAKKKLPAEIIDPMRKEMNRGGMAHGDWSSMGTPFEPIVSVKSKRRDHEITGLECGLPSAVCASLYARSCHDENAFPQAPFVISLSTEHTPGGIGGNFYLQDLKVLVKNAKNTLIVHRANTLHGTTVHDIDHKTTDPSMLSASGREHRGFSCFINCRLNRLWQMGKYDLPPKRED